MTITLSLWLTVIAVIALLVVGCLVVHIGMRTTLSEISLFKKNRVGFGELIVEFLFLFIVVGFGVGCILAAGKIAGI